MCKQVSWAATLNVKRLATGASLAVLLITSSHQAARTQSVPGRIPQPTTAVPQSSSGYILGAGDRLRLDIFNVPEYSGEYQVLVDGSLNLPIIGAVPVQGMTLDQASQTVSDRFSVLLRRSVVTLTLLEARPITIAIAGEVRRPGSYIISPTDADVRNLTQVLQLAGGVTGTADIQNVQVRRPRPQNQGVDLLTVNLWQLLRQGDLQQDLLLRDGDTIVIPTAVAVNLDDARQLANTSFAASQSEPVQVAIVGEVNRPGPYTLMPVNQPSEATAMMPTVTQAIQTAGGITQMADIRNIEVRRTTSGGTQQQIKVDFWRLLQSGELNQDLPLQSGDTIVIPAAIALSPREIAALSGTSFSPAQMTVNVVGEVARPGAIAVPPNTPLNQALLAAGGFNNRARRGSVELIRLNPDGTVSRQTISVDFAQGLNAEDNPALRPNDTVIVGRSGVAGLGDALGTLLSPITGVFSLFRLLGL